MQTLSKLASKRYATPHVFNCIVNGEELVARVIGEEQNPIHYVFVVEFSNGAIVRFNSIEDGWLTDPGFKEYGRQVERQMDEFFFEIYISGKCS